MKKRIYVRENSWLARRAARNLNYDYIAMVFRNTIHLHNTSIERFFSSPTWVIHELKHVEQFERHGTLPFLVRYGLEHLRKGYWNNAFEVEARAAESDWELLYRYDLSAYKKYLPIGY